MMQFVERNQNLRLARALRRALRFRSPYGGSVARHPRFRIDGSFAGRVATVMALRRERHRCEPDVPIDAAKIPVLILRKSEES